MQASITMEYGIIKTDLLNNKHISKKRKEGL